MGIGSRKNDSYYKVVVYPKEMKKFLMLVSDLECPLLRRIDGWASMNQIYTSDLF